MNTKIKKSASGEKTARSIGKAITYRILSILMDTIIAYSITQNANKTFWLVLISNTVSILMYFVHERVWDKIKWGKKQDPNCPSPIGY